MSQMKFASSPENCVKDMLNGLSYNYVNLFVNVETKLVFYKQANNEVKILSGGGSGHEPFCAGFVGNGMLSAAVAGEIFTSPPSHNILDAISTLSFNNNNNGVLIIIMNYTGDILNFGLAMEQARLQNIQIESVTVNEDCSRSDEETFTIQRRGMCGGVFVMKIAGAMARDGNNLIQIKNTCCEVISKLGSIGACVTSCTVPGVGVLFNLNSDEMEVGIGVHGEAGAFRSKLIPVQELIQTMMTKILKYLHMELENNCEVCVLINNLGSVSQLEMSIISDKVHNFFHTSNIKICRMYVGSFMTSLDMAGFQICLLNTTANPEWITYLDHETDAPAWPKTPIYISPDEQIIIKPNKSQFLIPEGTTVGLEVDEVISALFKNCLKTCAEKLIQNKDYLNELDKTVGDGDTGTTLSNLAKNVLQDIDSFPTTNPASCFLKLAEIAQYKMGGTLGALYSLMFIAAAEYFKINSELSWYLVYESTLQALKKYSIAKLGDRTMIDVLIPVYEEYRTKIQSESNQKDAFISAVSNARKKLYETRFMIPKVGRASYVSCDLIKTEDAGAYAVTLILEGILMEIEHNI